MSRDPRSIMTFFPPCSMKRCPTLKGCSVADHSRASLVTAPRRTRTGRAPDERVHHNLEHVGEHVLLRIRPRPELRRRLAFPFVEQRRAAFSRIRGQFDETSRRSATPRGSADMKQTARDALRAAPSERDVQLLGPDPPCSR